MANSGATSPQTVVNTGTGNTWFNVGQVTATDNIRATGSANGNTGTARIKCTNFGFGISGDATIDGIKLLLERSTIADQGNTRDSVIQLLVNGTAVGSNKFTSTNWPASDTVLTYGGSSDTWGRSWSATEITTSLFGCEVRATGRPSKALTQPQVDHVTITVYFTSGVGGGRTTKNTRQTMSVSPGVGFMTHRSF